MTKTILITGSTDGIGRHLALTLARDGHEVILHGRNKEKLQETLMSLQQETGSNLLHAYRADFSKLEEVKQFNKAIQKDFRKLDVLINNAGIFSGTEWQANKENVELTFMVSVLAPYMIIKDLQPLLARSEAGRIINTSSYMHHFADTTDLDFGFERSYSPKLAYNNSKLYIIWLTRYFSEQFVDKKLPITVNAYHPGLIATKMVTGGKPIITKQANTSQSSEDKNQPKSVEEGIKTGYYLAISAEVADQSGLYFDDCQVKPVAEKSFSQVSLQKLLTYCEDKLSVQIMDKLLLEPLQLPNGQVLESRFFKSAMSETMADKQQAPSDDLIALYDYWAKQGMDVLVTGNVMVDGRYLGEPGNVVLDSDAHLNQFRKWAAVGQKNGVPIWLQLNHPGKQMYRSINQTPIAPSAIPISGGSASAFRPPREMTVFEIKEARDKFIASGVRAKAAGFTGVQLHAAHGYLINQFLSPADNQRTDLYGGSLDNRMRFLVEIYQGLREKVGPDFTIALKLNASDFKEEGFGFEDCKYVVKRMSELGIDLIEISGGNYETPVFGGEYESGAGFVTYAVALADLTSVPIVSTGGFRKVAQMEEAIEEGVAMIGLARPFVLRPSLVNDYREDRDFQLSTPRLTTGLPKLDQALGPIIGVSYYEAQMKRLAKGRSAKISKNAWPYLLQTVRAHGLSALKPRRK